MDSLSNLNISELKCLWIFVDLFPRGPSARYFNSNNFIKNIELLIFQLNAIKTCGLGASLVTLLFFTTSTFKFCLVQQDDKSADRLEMNKSYFLKNVSQKFDNIYVASNSTVITMSKKPVENAQRL